MNIGIFGGSFNPIHIGHLALANYLCEYGEVDEVWFLVSPHNPLKERLQQAHQPRICRYIPLKS